ncbi:hypothetical protein CONCODRAFT_11697 [Conidiobolus coronatus NRRL 28638]|uniref:Uncharacterized protein n=1 Tax=Conidiobolus coronatus (strain ATCC 28846 / CBS 209.66 / NRRL 28638) TaxID=796925 RepID=A0A137NUR4_CONC2|nr:hypothetical protein CONCODRAFT_11697 [Conidiobolus coronatus NRRL 28638]|eukprot:KXN66462.1 hypothetical protein CONCODRAFT_11697 [Conidiobolus coronatus NRRL 28638]
MFVTQSSIWFGQVYHQLRKPNELTDLFDCGMTTGLSIIEFIFNVVTLSKIIKEAYKSRSPIMLKLLVKLVGVVLIFTIADVALTVIYIVKNKYYSLIFTGLLLALKIQTEYFCLNRIRQCILIAHSIHNA